MKDMKIPIPSTENEQIPVPISPLGTLYVPTIATAQDKLIIDIHGYVFLKHGT